MNDRVITISIIGHRDLLPNHIDIIEQHLTKILQDIINQHPLSILHFMSPLAEGSDQLGAQVALALGYKLIVPLPMEQKNYLENFDDNSKQMFYNLSQQAYEQFTLKCDECSSKEDQYLNLGKYVIQNSNILLVLWDGVFSDKIGGTGYIMQYIHELQTASQYLEKIIDLRTPRRCNSNIDSPFSIDIIKIDKFK